MKASVGKRVLMLLENNPYKQDIRVKREARALVAAGYQVTVVCPKHRSGGKLREICEDCVILYQFPAPRGGEGMIGYVWEFGYSTFIMFLLTLLVWVREGFQVIHAHNPPDTMFLIAAFFKMFGKKLIFDHHDLSPEMYFARFGENSSQTAYKLLLLFEKLTFRMANHVISTNESYKKIAMERGSKKEAQITIVRNGPDTESFHLVVPDEGLKKRASTILGYIGIMGPQDGLDYLLRAMQKLVYEIGNSDVFCVIIGKGDAIPQLKLLAKELKVDKHVWFTGWISDEDLIRYLSTVDICLDPDPSNPFNDRCTMIKMMEYMAAGKPIVAFNLPEHKISAGNAALYAKNNNEKEFAEMIEILINDSNKRREMGEIGLNRIQNGLAWTYQKTRLLQAYQTIFTV